MTTPIRSKISKQRKKEGETANFSLTDERGNLAAPIFCYERTAIGRKRTSVFLDFSISNVRLWPKAVIKLISAFMIANDPKRTFPVHEHVQRWLNLQGFTKISTSSLFADRYCQPLEFSGRIDIFSQAHHKKNQAVKNVT